MAGNKVITSVPCALEHTGKVVSVRDWPEQCSLRVEAYNNELATTVLVKGTAGISNLSWQHHDSQLA